MHLHRFRRTAAGIVLFGLLLGAGCDRLATGPNLPSRLRIATGSPGGVYYLYGTAYARLIQRASHTRPTVLVTAASAENVAKVSNHDAEIGFTQADIAATAQPGRILALARLYDDYVHLVVREDDTIRTLDGIERRRVSLGEPGSGTEVTAERLLKVAGIDPSRDISASRLSLDDAASALRERRIDAFFFSGGLPVTAVSQLARTVRIRLVDLSGYVPPLRKEHGAYYTARVVPESAYGTSPVMTIAIANYLVVPADLPDATAYGLTSVLFAGHDELARMHPAGARLNPRNAINTQPLQLHPGALRYFRESKA